ncbi:MAG: DUF3144 domain-containing protein [Pseudomonadota bacterium]
MSEQQKQIDAHNKATERFITLANQMANDEGLDIKMISAALMAASGVYATFMAAGNQGFLAPGGVDRVAEVYKNNLGYIQERKKQELEAQGLEPKPMGEVSGSAEAPKS